MDNKDKAFAGAVIALLVASAIIFGMTPISPDGGKLFANTLSPLARTFGLVLGGALIGGGVTHGLNLLWELRLVRRHPSRGSQLVAPLKSQDYLVKDGDTQRA